MRVLALCSYPAEAAATRFRLQQFVRPLAKRGVELDIKPFLDSRRFRDLYRPGGLAGKALKMVGPALRRAGDSLMAGRYDMVFIQREAMLFGPAVFEWLSRTVGRVPMVLDLDDATYVHYVSPTYGRLGSFFKFFGKTDNLIRRSQVVVCGNRFIADYVERLGSRAVVVPTVVDLDEFRPREKSPESAIQKVCVGWIGTHSTFPFLKKLFPVLESLAEAHRFKLKIVGAGDRDVELKDIEVENLDWNLKREVEDFRSLDIGLYPIFPEGAASDEWIKGKSGFKAIQYMACGLPFVMTPVGVCAELGQAGITHFNAVNDEDWYNSLGTLLSQPERRVEMGEAARRFAVENFSVEEQADKLVEILFSVRRQ